MLWESRSATHASTFILSAYCLLAAVFAQPQLPTSQGPKLIGPKFCCDILSSALPGQVFFSSETQYLESLASYYSGQAGDISPQCIVRPTSASQVSTTIRVLSSFHKTKPGSCPFAVRGGGHNSYAEAANIEAGITIDLRALNKVTLQESGGPGRVTSVGAGALWRDIYTKLDPMNLSVVGGRADTVGVAGLTTGGGISYFSGRYGLVCDNVVNYEIVLADGHIVNANSVENTDLRTALRGGSNNFGIVTRFDLMTFEQGHLWGGDVLYDFSTSQQQLEAFVSFGSAKQQDEHAALYQVFASRDGLYFILNNMVYTKPSPYPAVFQGFNRIQPQLMNGLKTAPLSQLITNVTNPDDFKRHMYITTSTAPDLPFLQWLVESWKTFTTSASLSNVRNLENTLLNQFLTSTMLKNAATNSLGLSPSDPIIVSLLSLTWSDAEDDAAVRTAARAFMQSVETEAKKRRVHRAYLYLNYADGGQNVMDGYGKSSKEKLRRISKRYDPRGVFQKAVPGGFKLWP